MRSILALSLLLLCAAPLAAQDTLRLPSRSPAPTADTSGRRADVSERPTLLRGALDAVSRVRIRPRSEAAVAVPELRGLPEADARVALQRAGLALGAVDELPVAGRAPGTVVMQRPEPGVRLDRGDAVAVMLVAPPAVAAAPVTPSLADPRRTPPQERPAVPPPVVARPPVAEPPPVTAPQTPVEPIAVLPSAQTDAIGDAVAEPAPLVDAPADPRSKAEPTVPAGEPVPSTTSTPDGAVPSARTGTDFRWLAWLIAALVVLAAAATLRRLRAGGVPTAVSARMREGVVPAVELRGTPFGGPRVRMRLRSGEPASSASTSPFALR